MHEAGRLFAGRDLPRGVVHPTPVRHRQPGAAGSLTLVWGSGMIVGRISPLVRTAGRSEECGIDFQREVTNRLRKNKLRELIRLFEESSLHELECAGWVSRIRFRKASASPTHAAPPATPQHSQPVADEPAAEVSREHVASITSPMVGTFYRAPAPDARPYVEVGDLVSEGQVVCIVEAMKLFNEIESEHTGRIVSAVVEDAHPVEYGQVLFEVDTSVRA
jgi:acetyl-CoA carboxylase biotin carboxyl carrier protein